VRIKTAAGVLAGALVIPVWLSRQVHDLSWPVVAILLCTAGALSGRLPWPVLFAGVAVVVVLNTILR